MCNLKFKPKRGQRRTEVPRPCSRIQKKLLESYRAYRFRAPPFCDKQHDQTGSRKRVRWNDYYGPAGMIITDFVDDYVQDYVRDFCVYVRRFCLELAQPI